MKKNPFDVNSLKILFGPHEILSKTSKNVTTLENLKPIIQRMEYLMDETKGIGLAAPQVGLNINLFITKTPEKPLSAIINPKIISTSQSITPFNEGCLSFPGIEVEVQRFSEIEVEYQNLANESKKEVLYGLDSICFQHEYDHLLGTTLLSRINNKSKQKSAKNEVEKTALSLKSQRPDLYY